MDYSRKKPNKEGGGGELEEMEFPGSQGSGGIGLFQKKSKQGGGGGGRGWYGEGMEFSVPGILKK